MAGNHWKVSLDALVINDKGPELGPASCPAESWGPSEYTDKVHGVGDEASNLYPIL